jgi:hypothetical protein
MHRFMTHLAHAAVVPSQEDGDQSGAAPGGDGDGGDDGEGDDDGEDYDVGDEGGSAPQVLKAVCNNKTK